MGPFPFLSLTLALSSALSLSLSLCHSLTLTLVFGDDLKRGPAALFKAGIGPDSGQKQELKQIRSRLRNRCGSNGSYNSRLPILTDIAIIHIYIYIYLYIYIYIYI